MVIFLNPFKKHDVSDFPDVYVPLEGAQRNPSVVAENAKKLGAMLDDLPTYNKGDDENGLPGPNANAIELLRAEIDLDVAASGHDSAYDRKSKVINKAIQDIGMGTYQWKLFCLCGFGWLADK